jgi:poly(3-hydroxybutyrate) depolymerase
MPARSIFVVLCATLLSAGAEPPVVTKPDEVTWQTVRGDLPEDDATIRQLRDWLSLPPDKRSAPIPQVGLSKSQAEQATAFAWGAMKRDSLAACEKELGIKAVKAAGKEMRYLERVFGKAAAGKRSLWISMHGGGGAPTRVNDSQWRNQIRLYQPEEGIVVAPRAPTDAWNLWHQAHIDNLFDRLISNFVIARGVDPDRIYLMGYSAGGDGVYQLAPRMADRFAAAAMMAGHPNDASPLSLRNLPFMIFVGGNDGGYKRNKVAAEWGGKLAALRAEDKDGYPHKLTIYEGLGHWMNGRDSEALPWMAKRRRGAWPDQVVWRQGGRTHNRFYWLAVPAGCAKKGQTIRAIVTGQRIDVQADGIDRITLRLSDQLVDLDQPVVVTVNGNEKFKGKVDRTLKTIWKSLQQRMDPVTIATGQVDLRFDPTERK